MAPYSGIAFLQKVSIADPVKPSQFDLATRDKLISGLLECVNVRHNDAMGAKLVDAVIEVATNVAGYSQLDGDLYIQYKGAESLNILSQLSSTCATEDGRTLYYWLPLTKEKLLQYAIDALLVSVGDSFQEIAAQLLTTKTCCEEEEDVLEKLLKTSLDKKGRQFAALLETAVKRRPDEFNPVVLQGFGIAVSRFKDRRLLDSLYAREPRPEPPNLAESDAHGGVAKEAAPPTKNRGRKQ